MKMIFNGVALVCLVLGLGGIVWCGDWRLLLSFPAAFGLGMMRTMTRGVPEEAQDGILSLLPWPKVVSAMRVFFTFCLVFMTVCALLHFTRTPDDLIWTKACWYAGLVLLPWNWRWEDVRSKVESLAVFPLTLICAVMIVVLPKLTDVWVMAEAFLLLAVLVVANAILKRKGVTA